MDVTGDRVVRIATINMEMGRKIGAVVAQMRELQPGRALARACNVRGMCLSAVSCAVSCDVPPPNPHGLSSAGKTTDIICLQEVDLSTPRTNGVDCAGGKERRSGVSPGSTTMPCVIRSLTWYLNFFRCDTTEIAAVLGMDVAFGCEIRSPCYRPGKLSGPQGG